MRLDVGVLGAEEGGGAGDRDAFGGVRVVAAAVVAGARVALGVLVGERRGERGEDGGGAEILGGDQLERTGLSEGLVPEHLGDLRVGPRQRAEVPCGAAGGRGAVGVLTGI